MGVALDPITSCVASTRSTEPLARAAALQQWRLTMVPSASTPRHFERSAPPERAYVAAPMERSLASIQHGARLRALAECGAFMEPSGRNQWRAVANATARNWLK